MHIKLEESIAIFVDYQEKLMPAIHNHEQVIAKAVQLLTGLKAVGCPVIFTQQYTKGLGMTVPELVEIQDEFRYLEKITYSCLDTEEIKEELKKQNKKTIILAGVEAHICVMQTARDLIAEGYNVCIVTDCISSRTEENRQVGLERMKQEGAYVTSVESVLFELLMKAGTPEFKTVSKLIK